MRPVRPPPEHSRAETKIQRTFLLKGLLRCSVCQSFMSPHYTQKRRKAQSINRIAYYRCTKTMQHSNSICTIKALNADAVERQVIEYLSTLSQQAEWVKVTVEELNLDQKEQVRPLEQEAIRLKASLNRLEREIDRLVRGVGQGTVSVQRLEDEMRRQQQEQHSLETQYQAVQRQIQEHTAREYDSEVVLRNLKNFQRIFAALLSKEKMEVLRCLVRDIIVHPDKLVFNIFELAEVGTSSQERKGWLPGSNESEYWRCRVRVACEKRTN
ncbi:MAG: recombinase zinc beta ribbon domain-containing protein [Nitrospira sp.]|nr:recombinase zinc beta ribbon domain-containing protein [Nitrospira sp.]